MEIPEETRMARTAKAKEGALERSRSSSCASSFDESFFYQNYVPLSNLPTPPLGCSSATTSRPASDLIMLDEPLDPALFGPAVHITNLIPSSTSLLTPSPATVQAILTRAALPVEIVALAACILDSLNSRFALTWRLNCPLNTPSSSPQEPHIDNVRPELLALAALILSAQFLDDFSSGDTRAYVRNWGRGLWSCQQVNFTQRCLLENIGYSLLPLCKEGIIRDAIRDMERAARRSDVVLYHSSPARVHGMLRVEAQGVAVAGEGEQLTPAETPTMEKACSPFEVVPDRFTRSWGAYPEISDSCG